MSKLESREVYTVIEDDDGKSFEYEKYEHDEDRAQREIFPAELRLDRKYIRFDSAGSLVCIGTNDLYYDGQGETHQDIDFGLTYHDYEGSNECLQRIRCRGVVYNTDGININVSGIDYDLSLTLIETYDKKEIFSYQFYYVETNETAHTKVNSTDEIDMAPHYMDEIFVNGAGYTTSENMAWEFFSINSTEECLPSFNKAYDEVIKFSFDNLPSEGTIVEVFGNKTVTTITKWCD